MIALVPSLDNPSRESPDTFISATVAGLLALSAGVSAGASVYGAKKSGDAVNRSTAANAAAASSQEKYLREKDAQEKAAFDATQAENRRQFDVTEAARRGEYDAREARLSPYREIGANATNTLAGLLGYQPSASYAPRAYTPSTYAPSSAAAASGGSVAGAAAAGAAPSDYQSWFMGLVNGKPPSSETLTALAPELAKRNVSLAPNAAGINGKIKLPSGEIIDVGRAFSSANPGDMAWQWLPPGGSGGGGGRAASSAAPFYGPSTLGALAQPAFKTTRPDVTPVFTLADFLNMRAPRYSASA